MRKAPAPPPLTPAQQALAAAYLPIARRVAREFAAKFPRLADEFAGEAALALCVAAAAFDPARNDNFAGWAAWKVRGAMVDYIRLKLGRSESRRKKIARIAHTAPLHPWSAPSGEPPVGAEAESAEGFARLVGPCGPRTRRLLAAIYAGGCTHAEAGGRVGVGESRARQLHADAIAALRAAHAGTR